MFEIGQKVVCVDDSLYPGATIWHPRSVIKKGCIYTVRELGTTWVKELPGVKLEEVQLIGHVRPCVVAYDLYYRANRFRPLEKKSTDISIFTDMLKSEEFV